MLSTRPRAAASRRVVGLSLALALCPCARTFAQAAPISPLTCGAYEAVPGGKASNGQPTRLNIQKDGRLLLNVSDWSITRVDCADIDADKTTELLVSTSSGGAHCCETLRVWTLGKTPQELLEYPSGNAAGFELRDLDGDGRTELVVGDDAFAYFGDLCYACSPSHLPMVLCRAARGFEDCTRRFPEFLRSALPRYTARLQPPASEEDRAFVKGAALGALAVWSLLGEEDEGLAAIRAAVASDEVMKWLERARPHVRDWMAARGKKPKAGK